MLAQASEPELARARALVRALVPGQERAQVLPVPVRALAQVVLALVLVLVREEEVLEPELVRALGVQQAAALERAPVRARGPEPVARLQAVEEEATPLGLARPWKVVEEARYRGLRRQRCPRRRRAHHDHRQRRQSRGHPSHRHRSRQVGKPRAGNRQERSGRDAIDTQRRC